MTRKYGRSRDLGEECPRCGSKPAEPCLNYKGKRKAPCKIKDDPAPSAAERRGHALTQGYLFGERNMSDGES